MRANFPLGKSLRLSDIYDDAPGFDIIAIDIPVGLSDSYEVGGRLCDRAARKLLGRPRGSSVFPAPIRPVLAAKTYQEACCLSRGSGPFAKAISKQTSHILPKVKEVDDFIQKCPELRRLIREIHPEVSFCELAGSPMKHNKKKCLGREERRKALANVLPEIHAIEESGRKQRLPTDDILDAAVACWSGLRLANGLGHSLPNASAPDSIAIWI